MPVTDPLVRKTFYKLVLYIDAIGAFASTLSLRYDQGSPDVIQPQPITVSSGTQAAVLYGSSNFGSSSGILGPISSNVVAMVNTDKYEVKPKEKKNVVVAYEQEVDNNQQADSQDEVDGNEIPSFTLRPDFMIDDAKVDVLGIVI